MFTMFAVRKCTRLIDLVTKKEYNALHVVWSGTIPKHTAAELDQVDVMFRRKADEKIFKKSLSHPFRLVDYQNDHLIRFDGETGDWGITMYLDGKKSYEGGREYLYTSYKGKMISNIDAMRMAHFGNGSKKQTNKSGNRRRTSNRRRNKKI